jgi:hypothetical protein
MNTPVYQAQPSYHQLNIPSYSAPLKFDNLSSLKPNPNEPLEHGDVQFMQLKEPVLHTSSQPKPTSLIARLKSSYGTYMIMILVGAIIGCFAHMGSSLVEHQVVDRCIHTNSVIQRVLLLSSFYGVVFAIIYFIFKSWLSLS